jgi:hypothetical protein
MDRREELERWIAGSRATQHTLKLGLYVAGAISIVLLFVSRAAGAIGIFIVAFVAAAGFWITNGHIGEWEAKIYKLDHPEKPSATTRKRRYEAD